MADLLIVYSADAQVAENYTPHEGDQLARRLYRQMKKYGIVVLPPGYGATLVPADDDSIRGAVEIPEDTSTD